MPRKIRQLKADLGRAGFVQQADRGKGSHGIWLHEETNVTVTVSGQDGRDARAYQEAEVRAAVASVRTKRTERTGERGAS